MVRITSRVADAAYLLLRLVAALLFAEHGVQKLFGVLGGSRCRWCPNSGWPASSNWRRA